MAIVWTGSSAKMGDGIGPRMKNAYRYSLTRTFRGNGGKVCWVMLNPTTADHDTDDATIRRCCRFSTDFGYSEMVIVNLYAFRSRHPTELWKQDDPIGPENDAHIAEAVKMSDRVICAWGVNAKPERAEQVLRMIDQPYALKVNKGGQPSHPLMLASYLTPVMYGRW